MAHWLKERFRDLLIFPPVSYLLVRPLRALRLGAMLHRVPVAGRVCIRTRSGGRAWMSTARGLDAIAAEVFWRGETGHEPEATRLLPQLAAGCRGFVDVGANTGLYTLLVAAYAPQAKLLCFEPVPRIADALRANIALNGLSDRATVRQEAVAAGAGDATLHVPRVRPLPSSASLKSGIYGDCDTVTVRTSSVDAGVRETGMERCDLIKIDVEGRTANVLQGMPQVLAQHAPRILSEVLSPKEWVQVRRILRPHGYAAYALEPTRCRPVEDSDAAGDALPTTNVLWLPKKDALHASFAESSAAADG